MDERIENFATHAGESPPNWKTLTFKATGGGGDGLDRTGCESLTER
jgi:hypothetical protein